MKFKVQIGTFGDDDTAPIRVDGREVGWLERVHGERFKSATSYARVQYVSHYSIMLTDDGADDHLRKHDVDTRGEAKLEVERAFDGWWEAVIKTDPAATALPREQAQRSAVPGYSNYGGGGPFAPMGSPRPTPTPKRIR